MVPYSNTKQGFVQMAHAKTNGGTFNMDNPVAYKNLLDSMNNKKDILNQGQMIKVPDAAEFKKAQKPELEGLEDLGVF